MDPVLQQLQGNAGAKLSYDDVIGGYKRIKDDYEKNAKGAKDVIAAVFFDYHEVRTIYNAFARRLTFSVCTFLVKHKGR